MLQAVSSCNNVLKQWKLGKNNAPAYFPWYSNQVFTLSRLPSTLLRWKNIRQTLYRQNILRPRLIFTTSTWPETWWRFTFWIMPQFSFTRKAKQIFSIFFLSSETFYQTAVLTETLINGDFFETYQYFGNYVLHS